MEHVSGLVFDKLIVAMKFFVGALGKVSMLEHLHRVP